MKVKKQTDVGKSKAGEWQGASLLLNEWKHASAVGMHRMQREYLGRHSILIRANV